MGLKSQLPGSIMPARERSVAILALCSCPLATAPTPPWCHARLGRASPVKLALAGSSATSSPRGVAPKTPRCHAVLEVASLFYAYLSNFRETCLRFRS